MTLAPVAILAQSASAAPKGDPTFKFSYKVVATTFIKKANETITPPPGTFKGSIDLNTGKLTGNISIPPSTFTQSEAGIGLLTTTAATVPTKPVTGHVDLKTFKISSTSVFNIWLKSMYVPLPKLPVPVPIPPVNLVGNSCTTVAPIAITMKGVAHLSGPSTFSSTFTIPDFQNCQAMTTVLNQEIPGPGNTFTATVTPT